MHAKFSLENCHLLPSKFNKRHSTLTDTILFIYTRLSQKLLLYLKLGFELVVRTQGRGAAAPRKIPFDRFIAEEGGGFPVESPNKIDYC